MRQNNIPAGGNMRPPASVQNNNNNNVNTINRPSSSSSNISNSGNSQSNDFITFLTNATNNNINNPQSNSNNNSNNSNNMMNNSSVNNPPPNSPNAIALNRLETIRQYYMQLSNNLRLITQQLQSPDLTASKRQALLMEQARANAAMQEFTEKILKPISASKQQQQAQMNNQRSANYSSSNAAANTGINPNLLQFANRPPQTSIPAAPQQIPQLPVKPPSNYPAAQSSQSQQQQQRPPNVNLYSQSGLGMIRPIINAAPPSAQTVNRSSAGTVNVNMNFRPQSIPIQSQQQQQQQQASPQRSFRPAAIPGNLLASPAIGIIPPATPSTNKSLQQQQQQQFMVNRQSYLIAAQQHQTTVAQQQILFQQRLSLFARDPITQSSSPSQKRSALSASVVSDYPPVRGSNKKFKPVLALPPATTKSSIVPSIISNSPTTDPQKSLKSSNFPAFPTTSASNAINSKYSSLPTTFPNQISLSDLAKQFKLTLSSEAERFLLRVADEFIDNLARVSFKFALHRKKKVSHTSANTIATAAGSKSSKKQQQQQTVPVPLVPEESEPDELNLSIEDFILSLDEVINYQPAGSGSIQNCRPLTRKPAAVAAANNSTTESTSTSASTSNTSNHQHRLNLVKKHSSLYQYF